MAKAKPAAPAKINPLNANDIAGARAIIDTYGQLQEYVKSCTNCGMDMGPIIEQSKAYRDFAEAVLNEFGHAESA